MFFFWLGNIYLKITSWKNFIPFSYNSFNKVPSSGKTGNIVKISKHDILVFKKFILTFEEQKFNCKMLILIAVSTSCSSNIKLKRINSGRCFNHARKFNLELSRSVWILCSFFVLVEVLCTTLLYEYLLLEGDENQFIYPLLVRSAAKKKAW